MILIYLSGQRRLYRAFSPVLLQEFLREYRETYATMNRISGTALFFARDVQRIPPYVARTMFVNNILYQDNILVSIVVEDAPFGVTSDFKRNLAEGLRTFEIRHGYLELVDIVPILRDHGIHEKAIFYGLEEIVSDAARLADLRPDQAARPDLRPVLPAAGRSRPRGLDPDRDVIAECRGPERRRRGLQSLKCPDGG